ncbi:hypothetical protein GHT07_07360 [Caenimonas koreensis DSM 17982]|uniref:Uncharacterized protein n=1 Tax=Caenimonas koreensis DSM 17982 TaxID=1121255 RepID=A0A844B991_9BURK|nr:SctK family type III secretion system sorting platform protein [Caenimonas koreensis]MRD47091.1 hypothetical protein [Caenimonas koreensis DSM 17982]
MKVTPPPAELVRLVGAQPEVARAICIFNQNPADYLDSSRRSDFFSKRIGDALWDSPRSRSHLSRLILERIGASPCLEVARTEWPVALLERDRIDRLARHVAAALVGARVRRCVSRAEVLKWRDWLSQEAHEFALTRAGLLPVTADVGDPRQGHAGGEEVTALQVGYAWIAAATRVWPDSIRKRFMLKLPAGSSQGADAIDGALASRLVTSVLTNLESRWCSSFATTRG